MTEVKQIILAVGTVSELAQEAIKNAGGSIHVVSGDLPSIILVYLPEGTTSGTDKGEIFFRLNEKTVLGHSTMGHITIDQHVLFLCHGHS